ncbi:methionyl-tRNA formyltransferase [bacterium]|nr:methionyl-tRNA formyltransferase [bacterium]
MKIVFFGNPDFCFYPLKNLNNSNHELISVVTSTDRKSGRGLKLVPSFVKKTALNFDIPIIEVDDIKSKEFEERLVSLEADLFVVVAFKFLPDSIINIPKYGSINIHPSLLPKYRGSSPIQYALLNGDVKTGVSIIHLNSKIDSGAILGQEKIDIGSISTFGEIYEKLGILSSELIIKVINDINRKKINPVIQDESKKTLAPKIKKEDLKIDWNNSSLDIHNKIRAFDPFPGAYCFLNGKRIKLFGSSEFNYDDGILKETGEIIIKDKLLLIKTNTKKMINISMVQLEGKNKISSSDFIKSLENKKYILK